MKSERRFLVPLIAAASIIIGWMIYLFILVAATGSSDSASQPALWFGRVVIALLLVSSAVMAWRDRRN